MKCANCGRDITEANAGAIGSYYFHNDSDLIACEGGSFLDGPIAWPADAEAPAELSPAPIEDVTVYLLTSYNGWHSYGTTLGVFTSKDKAFAAVDKTEADFQASVNGGEMVHFTKDGSDLVIDDYFMIRAVKLDEKIA